MKIATAQAIFDLDGTLIDSAPDLHQAVNRMLAEHGRDPLPLAEVRGMVGDGAGKLIERALETRGLSATLQAQALKTFLAFYEEDPLVHTRVYPGVPEALQALKDQGLPLALCTNKPEAPTREILRRLDLARYFDRVTGGDTHPFRKPDPRMLLSLLAPGISPGAAVLVGDSEVDAATAAAAGVPFVLMSYGYHRGPVEGIANLARLADMRALPALLV